MQPAWRLTCFGEVSLRSDEICLTNFQTKRAAKLLVLLALSRTGSMRRDDLADLLWPEDFLDSTRLRLRQELARLRRAMGDAAGLITTNQETVSISTGAIETDLQALKRATLEDSSDLRRMLEDDFLHGWDDVWVMPERKRANEVRIAAASRIAADLLENRNPQAALEVAQLAVKIDPLREDLRLLAMKAHTALGSLTDALTEYRSFKRQSGSTLPEPEIQVEPLEPTPTKLRDFELPRVPHPIDRLFGREETLERLSSLITDSPDIRLISVIGPGGIGKSRLAVEAFRRIGREEGFVSFVECGESSDPIAHLQEQLVPGHRFGDPVQVLGELIGTQETILILDNLEHLSDPGGFVTKLLQALPRLRLVITSRRPMKVAGERTIALGPLDRSEEALRMLEHLTGSRVGDLKGIVDRCDGMPLTLRLAAARLRFLDPDELIKELDSEATLKANLADLPERQRDLSTMLRLSCADLSPDDAQALLQISVYPGGVTRSAAKGFLGDKVDDTLERLLDAALLWLDDELTPLRFRMLEPVRQFVQRGASDQELGDAEINLVTQAVRATESFFPVYALTPRFDRTLYRQEASNFRRAFEIGVTKNLPETLVLLNRLWHHELGAGHREELVKLANACLQMPGLTASGAGFAHLSLAWCFSAEGKLDEAAQSGALSESFFIEAGDEPNACYARLTADEHLRYKSSTDEIEGRYQALIERCEKAVPVLLYMVRGWRGLTRTYRQDWQGAGADLEFAFGYAKSGELLDMTVTAGIGLLLVDHAKGHHDRRRERMEELRKAATELDDHHHWSVVQRAEARFALVDGDFEAAERHARRGLGIFGYSGNVLHETEIKVSLARALIGQKRFDEARDTIRETAAAVKRQLRRVGVVSLAALAEWCSAQGKHLEAQDHLSLALAYRDAHNVSIPNVEAEYIASLQQILNAEAGSESVTDEQVFAALTEG